MATRKNTPKVRAESAAVPSVHVVFSALVEIGAALSKARADLDILRISSAAEGPVAIAAAPEDAALDLAMRSAAEALDVARQWTANAVSKRYLKDFARGGQARERAMRLMCDYLDSLEETRRSNIEGMPAGVPELNCKRRKRAAEAH
jgi:hypothetical protein